MNQPQAPANGQGIIALACGHFRALPIADAQTAAQFGGLIACPECSGQHGGRVLIKILRSRPLPVPDWQQFYRDRAAAALAEYDARKSSGRDRRGMNFYAEMAGLLSEALRGWLEADDMTAATVKALEAAESEHSND